MSRYNEVYAEIKIKDKWYSLNPIIKNEKSGKFEVQPIIWGQSYLTPFFEYAREHCNYMGIPDDLSKELYEIIKPDDFTSDFGKEKKIRELYRNYYAVINFNQLYKIVKNPDEKQYRGFVDEKDIKLYEEDNEFEIENYYSIESFLLLSDNKKKRLRYYEWDDYSYGSIYSTCKEIITIVNILTNYFKEYSFERDLYFESCDNIRLIVYGS